MKQNITHSLSAKIIAFILLIVTACLTLTSALGTIYIVDNQLLTHPDKAMSYAFRSAGYDDASIILRYYLDGNEDSAHSYLAGGNATSFEIFSEAGNRLGSTYQGEETPYFFSFTFAAGQLGYSQDSAESNALYTVKIYLDPNFPVLDEYAFAYALSSVLIHLGYAIIPIGVVSAIAALACFIFLLCAAGHKKGVEGIVASKLTRKFPFDLLTAIVFTALFLLTYLSFESMYSSYTLFVFLGMGICFVAALIIGTLYCINFAVRVKLGKWWQNTLLYHGVRFFLRSSKKTLSAVGGLVHNLPLIWKTAIFCALFAVASLITVMLYSDAERTVLWLLGMIILLPSFLYIALMLRRLQTASRALASGDLSYHVDTSKMIWDFQDAGENLNQISVGMAHAVEDRLKSERFKTELITNVSHDIKTPLTSIINYADLIGKEESGNEKISEYSAVLLRQAERLKKLTEDLVEASKASSGSTEVLLSPCELGVLITQTVGEYEQTLFEHELVLIVKKPETPLNILADGRLLWRVLDNLMSNVYKYAQSGTRVYLSLEERNGRAVIVLKNTSRYALDLSPEALMERFVRGDASRHSDGNGLGLSIAQSLTELQSGRLALSVDGDLFKVTLGFDALS